MAHDGSSLSTRNTPDVILLVRQIQPLLTATPRSLRTFLDSSPLDILDHPLSTLVFVPKADHERLKAERAEAIAQLQQLQQQQQQQSKTIDDEIRLGQITALEKKNVAFDQTNKQLMAKIEEIEAKAKVHASENARLRETTQARPPPTPPTGPRNSDKQKDERNRYLEKENARFKTELKATKSTVADLTNQVAELRQVVPEATTLIQNYKGVEAEKEKILTKNRSLTADKERLKAENDHLRGHNATLEEKLTEQANLVAKLRFIETNFATLQKTHAEVAATLRKAEQENKTLLAKNTDITDDNSILEKQSHQSQKQQILLSTELETLREKSLAEISALKDKLAGIGGGSNASAADELRLKLSLESSIKRLKTENSELQLELRKREDLTKKFKDVQGDFWALKASYGEQADFEKDLKIKYERLHKCYLASEAEIEHLRDTIHNHETVIHNLTREVGQRAEKYRPQKLQIENDGSTSASSGTTDTTDMSSSTERGNELTSNALQIQNMQKRKSLPTDRKGKMSEKRPRIDTEDLESPRIYRRQGATYLVVVPALVDPSALRKALATLQSDIQSLRPVFYGKRVKNEGKWVVKFGEAPRDFQKYVQVADVFANLYAGTGTKCMICDDEHDIWECPYLGAEGQERPNALQSFIKPRITTPRQSSFAGDNESHAGPVSVSGHLQQVIFSPNDQTSPRSLAERTSFPSHSIPTPTSKTPNPTVGRTLFDRIQEPSELPLSYSPHTEIIRLVTSTENADRCLFCRFKSIPPPWDWFISVVCGGRVEDFRIIDEKRVGFVNFVHPEDAVRFLAFAEQNYNSKIIFTNPDYPNKRGTLEFEWNGTRACRPIKLELAKGIVTNGWTRVLEFHGIKDGITAATIRERISDSYRVPFWVEPNDREGVVRAEFTTVSHAEVAWQRLRGLYPAFCNEVLFGYERCQRPVGLDEGLEFKDI